MEMLPTTSPARISTCIGHSNDPGCQDPIEAPTDKEVGLLECVYFTLDLGMISPLSHASIYRDHPDYDHLTHISSLQRQGDRGTGSACHRG